MQNKDVYDFMAQNSGTTRVQYIQNTKRRLKQEIIRYKTSQHKVDAVNLLNKAKEDTHAAEVLYRQKLYAPAVFHIQQAIEKTGKAVLYLEDINPAQRHTLIEVTEHWYNLIWRDTQMRARHGWKKYKPYSAVLVTSASTRTNTILIQAIDGRYKKPELINELYTSNKFKWEYQKRRKEKRSKEKNLHMTRFIEENNGRIRSFNAEEIGELVENIKHILNADLGLEYVPKYRQLLESSEMLFALALLTSPHQQTTRYSDSSRYYNEHIGIVKKLPDLIKEIKLINKLWSDLIR